jgi:hypothetical protein
MVLSVACGEGLLKLEKDSDAYTAEVGITYMCMYVCHFLGCDYILILSVVLTYLPPSFSFCVSSAGEPVDECGQWGTARQVQRHLHLATHQVHTHTHTLIDTHSSEKNVDRAAEGTGVG